MELVFFGEVIFAKDIMPIKITDVQVAQGYSSYDHLIDSQDEKAARSIIGMTFPNLWAADAEATKRFNEVCDKRVRWPNFHFTFIWRWYGYRREVEVSANGGVQVDRDDLSDNAKDAFDRMLGKWR